jgi:hypothetical protein
MDSENSGVCLHQVLTRFINTVIPPSRGGSPTCIHVLKKKIELLCMIHDDKDKKVTFSIHS